MARKYFQIRQLFFGLPLALMAGHAGAIDFSSYKAVKIVYGVNAVDFGPSATHGTVLLGWRENFNAHGFGVATFYLNAPKGAVAGLQRDDMLGLVSVWDGQKEELTVKTSGGADCVLHDFRLLMSNEHKPSLLVLADRKMGGTFVSALTATGMAATWRPEGPPIALGRPGTVARLFAAAANSRPVGVLRERHLRGSEIVRLATGASSP